MTVDRVLPCVCIKQAEPTKEWRKNGKKVMSKDGYTAERFPHLCVHQCLDDHDQRYGAYCPKCGRGDTFCDSKSPYLALKVWNELQERLWNKTELFV